MAHKTKPLTLRQHRFVNAVLSGMSNTEAARVAGYSAKSAEQQAVALMKVPEVAAAVDEVIRRRAERTEIDADVILRELSRIGMSDIGDAFDETGTMKPLAQMPLGVRRAISSVEVENIYEGRGQDRQQIGTLTKVRFWDKTRGLEMLGKNLKLFTDVHEVKITDLGEKLRKARQRAESK